MEESELERAITVGLHGAPELKRAERQQFLGVFQERVLATATKDQARAPRIPKEVEAAMKDGRAKAVIAHMDISFGDVQKYSSLAQAHGLSFTRKSDPSFQGDIGLVVISDEAVDDGAD